jgi:hypothetical protein
VGGDSELRVSAIALATFTAASVSVWLEQCKSSPDSLAGNRDTAANASALMRFAMTSRYAQGLDARVNLTRHYLAQQHVVIDLM